MSTPPTTPAGQLRMIEELIASGLIGAKGVASLFGIDESRAQEIIDKADRRRELLEIEESAREERIRLMFQ